MLAVLPSEGPIQIVATAVTPVVMVSATAILISGVNSRYIAISDRMRGLAHEFRDPATSNDRRNMIRRQMAVFEKRIHWVSWAVRNLFLAAAFFVTMALMISASLWRKSAMLATLPLFLIGIVLIMVAIVLTLLELHASNQTIFLEVSDILPRADSQHF